MSTEGPMSPETQSHGAFMFAIVGAMFATGISWAKGSALLVGLGWGLIACAIGLMVGIFVYWVCMD